jgi:cytochrome c oxidase accessory protein FixG
MPTPPSNLPTPSRDTVTTIRDDGSRRYLHPADARGRFTRARRLTATVLIATYLALPWIPIGGHPAVFLDIAARRFHLFGHTLAAQDLWLLFFLITGLAFSLFVITALFGRIWCGWTCPQTVFLEHIFRRIERLLEGDAPARRRLDAAPWTTGKTLRRAAKHALYITASALIAHLFLACFVSIPALWTMMAAAPTQHIAAFIFVFALTAILYFNFAWFREQLCIIICPYGRLQSALIDDNTLVIGYDTARGDPRGKPGAPGAGDCIDCNRCVHVCPTGIDIRQGLQLECIGCAACIDACDEVMRRLKRPPGLIRYASLNQLAGRATRLLRPRLFVYFALLCAGTAAALFALSTIKPVNIGITRMTGAPYYMDAATIRNQYNIRITNKQNRPLTLTLAPDPAALSSLPSGIRIDGLDHPIDLPANAETVRVLIVRIPQKNYTGSFRVPLTATSPETRLRITRAAEFIGPDPDFLKMPPPQ